MMVNDGGNADDDDVNYITYIRLLQRVEEDALVALPLTKGFLIFIVIMIFFVIIIIIININITTIINIITESNVISLPSAAVLKLQPSLNHDYVTGMKVNINIGGIINIKINIDVIKITVLVGITIIILDQPHTRQFIIFSTGA